MATPFDEAPTKTLLRVAKVLVVDDDEMLRHTASAMIRALGFEVISAADGQDAINQYPADRGDIALVVMDVTMPTMGGIEATQKIREIDPSAKVILHSGYWDNSPAVARPNAFLAKPYTFDAFKGCVHQVLRTG